MVEVTKVFRIWQGEEGFEVDLKFAGPTKDAQLTYRLIGPHGIPIEGEWYTTTYRDIFFGVLTKNGTEVITRTAYDAHKYARDPAQRVSTNPLEFAGVEDQYFATLLQPRPTPMTQEDRWEVGADSFPIKVNPEDTQKADMTVAIDSKPIAVGPNLGEVVHSYRVFAGPKTTASLAPFHAEELASYRKNQWITIPFAGTLAKNVIAPLPGSNLRTDRERLACLWRHQGELRDRHHPFDHDRPPDHVPARAEAGDDGQEDAGFAAGPRRGQGAVQG